eukprot:2227351-Pleurochrysis_carterae.AAC.2
MLSQEAVGAQLPLLIRVRLDSAAAPLHEASTASLFYACAACAPCMQPRCDLAHSHLASAACHFGVNGIAGRQLAVGPFQVSLLTRAESAAAANASGAQLCTVVFALSEFCHLSVEPRSISPLARHGSSAAMLERVGPCSPITYTPTITYGTEGLCAHASACGCVCA